MRLFARSLVAVLVFASLSGSCGPRDVQTPDALAGHWEGHVTYRARSLYVALDIADSNGVLRPTFDAPDLLVRAEPLGGLSYAAPRVRFALPLGRETWAFDGWFRRNLIVGALRTPTSRAAEPLARLPQLALRRTTKRLEAYTADSLRLDATGGGSSVALFVPRAPGVHPAIALTPAPAGGRTLAVAELFARDGFVVAIGGDALLDAEVRALRGRLEVDPAHIAIWSVGAGDPPLPANAEEFVFPGETPGEPDSLVALARRLARLPPRPVPLVPQSR